MIWSRLSCVWIRIQDAKKYPDEEDCLYLALASASLAAASLCWSASLSAASRRTDIWPDSS